MKYEDIMPTSRFQRRLKLDFSYDNDEFVKNIEAFKVKIAKELENAKDKQSRGYTNECNYDIITVSSLTKYDVRNGYAEEKVELKETIDTSIDAGYGAMNTSYKDVDINEIQMKLDKSNIIGKRLTTSQRDVSYSWAYICVSGYFLVSEKEVLEAAVKESIGKEAYKIHKGVNTERVLKENVKCSYVELYMSGEISANALLRLTIDSCKM